MVRVVVLVVVVVVVPTVAAAALVVAAVAFVVVVVVVVYFGGFKAFHDHCKCNDCERFTWNYIETQITRTLGSKLGGLSLIWSKRYQQYTQSKVTILCALQVQGI